MNTKTTNNIYYTLRIAIAMCFIGHGAFGIITKAVWCNYFAVFGIEKQLSYGMMPFVGIVDIFLGVAMVVKPVRAIPGWLVVWGMLTALLRPLSGEPFPEFIERAGNYGAPLALLLLAGLPATFRGWFTKLKIHSRLAEKNIVQTVLCLQIVCFLLLLGHGLLNLQGKAAILNQYKSLGFNDPINIAQTVGTVEIIAALVLLIKPVRPLLFGLLIWKMGSELFYPTYAAFEWVERGGSYGVILALWFALKEYRAPAFNFLHVIGVNRKLKRETE